MIREELTYELVLEDESDEVYAVSLVSQPAIELGWVAFDKEEVKLQSIDEDKRLVMGPILIPEKRIIRVDGEGKTYHVFLKANTIEKLAQKYLKNKYNDAVTVEHEAERIDNVSLVESWIVESTIKDKSSLYGFAVPKGTWMGIMKIDDDALWQEVKSGKSLQGFSIEGLFSHQLAKYSIELDILEKEIEELTEEEAKVVLSKINKVILEAQPSVTSTYPGEVASGSIAPALLSEEGNINVFGLETEYFHICPGAVELFTHLTSMPMDDDTKGMVRSAALQADRVFDIEEDVLEDGVAEPKDLAQAIVLVADFKDLISEIDKITDMKHDVSFMDGHIKRIKELI